MFLKELSLLRCQTKCGIVFDYDITFEYVLLFNNIYQYFFVEENYIVRGKM